MAAPKVFANDGPRHVQLWFLQAMGLERYYFEGYWNAAELLIEAAMKDPKVFFPAANAYRQYIELHLKYLLACLRDLDIIKLEENELTGHNLCKLWRKAKDGVMIKWPESKGHPTLGRAESIVLEFHRIDKSGQETRYPRLMNGDVSLKNLPGELNFSGTKEKMKALYEVLDYCTEQFAEQLMAIRAQEFANRPDDWDEAA